MINLIRNGYYMLVETTNKTKLLILDDNKIYAWVYAEGIGEILVLSTKKHIYSNVLATGKYRLFKVKDDPVLTDLKHLELQVGGNLWQGYLLTKGIPTTHYSKRRIIPTKELISMSY